MIIDNDKFVALLAENSGIEKEKVESYLEELIGEVRAAFDENEGYEIDGFGIFSKLGANVLFIPSEELETEINYKYVGMEPIELPGSAIEETPSETASDEEENPLQGLLDGEDFDEEEDPFAELLTDTEEESEEPISDELDQLDDEDIEAMVEEEIQHEETEEGQEAEGSEDENIDTPTDDDSEDSEEKTLNDEREDEVEETPGPDKWGIDAHKEDDQEDAFAGLIGKDASEGSELLDEEDIFSDEGEENEDLSEEQDEEEIDFSALEEDEKEDDDFDDPFMELEEEQEETEEDFVPVVTNVSSEKTTTDEEEAKEEDSEIAIKSKTPSLKKSRTKKKSSPVFLYMILALVVLAGSGYLLAYFGIVNIKGITPSNTQVAQANTQVNQPQQAEPQTVLPEVEPADGPVEDEGNLESSADEPVENTGGNTGVDVSEEENTTKNDVAPLVADEKSPDTEEIISPVNIQANAEVYGLTGTATEDGNNGYTIVLYTLSRKAGADKQFERLSKDGYRVIIKEKPSEKYGALYRVSIGQFRSLADAAIAAEKVDSKTLGNYIITKI